jgi:hypothetical protein
LSQKLRVWNGVHSASGYNWATWKISSGSGLEKRECDRRDPSRWPCDTCIDKSSHWHHWQVAVVRLVLFAGGLRLRSYQLLMRFWPVNEINEMTELVSCMPTPQFGDESSWMRGSELVEGLRGSYVSFWFM